MQGTHFRAESYVVYDPSQDTSCIHHVASTCVRVSPGGALNFRMSVGVVGVSLTRVRKKTSILSSDSSNLLTCIKQLKNVAKYQF